MVMGCFETDTAVTALGEHRWRSELRRGWRVGKVPNGGYVLAIIGRAISASLDGAQPLSINAFYLEPTALGETEIEVEPLRTGRATQYATARMFQEESLKVLATAAYCDLDRLKGPSNRVLTPPTVPPIDEFEVHRPNAALDIHNTIDIRLVRGGEFFSTGTPTNSGEFTAYMQYHDGASIGALDLLMFVDMMPPPAFTLVPNVGWVPTVELTVQLRGKPAPGPLLCHAKSHTLMRGVTEADCEIWDSEGELVALARQTMKVRSMA